jgi:hypothetical protein
MPETKLKEELFKKLQEIEDETLIQSVINFIDIESDENSKIVFSEDQLELIEEAKISARQSGITNQKVFSKTKEWLNK